MAEEKTKEQLDADKKAADKAAADKAAADKAREQLPKVKYLDGNGKGPVEAFIVNRATNDVNVCELELRGGGRVQSVPKWHGKGERPPFAVWVE